MSAIVAVPHTPAGATHVRRRVVADLQRSGLRGDVLDDVALVISELVGNAVRHGAPLPGGVLQVGWQVDGRHVRVEVRDGGGRALPTPGGASTASEGGRGLGIVETLARQWGVEQDGSALVVWATVERPPEPVLGR